MDLGLFVVCLLAAFFFAIRGECLTKPISQDDSTHVILKRLNSKMAARRQIWFERFTVAKLSTCFWSVVLKSILGFVSMIQNYMESQPGFFRFKLQGVCHHGMPTWLPKPTQSKPCNFGNWHVSCRSGIILCAGCLWKSKQKKRLSMTFDIIHDILRPWKIGLQVRSPRLSWLKTQKCPLMWSERHLPPERVELESLPGKMWQQRWLWVVIFSEHAEFSVSHFDFWSSKLQRTDDVQQTFIRYTCFQTQPVRKFQKRNGHDQTAHGEKRSQHHNKPFNRTGFFCSLKNIPGDLHRQGFGCDTIIELLSSLLCLIRWFCYFNSGWFVPCADACRYAIAWVLFLFVSCVWFVPCADACELRIVPKVINWLAQ